MHQFKVMAAAACALAFASTGALAQTADLVLTGGKVVTVDGQDRIVTAVAVTGNKIVAVGSDAEIAKFRGPNTRVVELKGRTMLPGFIDSHSHVAGMANVEANFINIQVPPLKDGKAVIAKLKDAAAKLPKGAWLIGQGTYNQVMPTRAELDAAFPDNPVRLDWSVHDNLINHKAAITLGLTKDFPDMPKGSHGRYERTKDGEVMIARDAPVPWPKLDFTYAQMKAGVRTILDDFYLKKGVTTVSDMSDPAAYRAYMELRAEGKLPIRVRLNPFIGRGVSLEQATSLGLFTGFGDDWLRYGAVKFISDGVWGTTASVYAPFWEGSGTTWAPDNHGGAAFTQEQLNKAVADAHAKGWQIQIHANGDRAQDMAITAYEEAQKAFPRTDARHRIEHFAHFLVQDPARTEERLQRMKRNSIIPSPQIAFIWRLTDVNVKEPNVKFFPLKELIDRGFHPAGGVDTIGTQNFATYPMFSISRAVNRDTKYGRIVQPEQAISVIDGIRMFTMWAAEANFMEKTQGSIEVGKLADFVVLSADPLTIPKAKLESIQVDATIIDGKVAYNRAL